MWRKRTAISALDHTVDSPEKSNLSFPKRRSFALFAKNKMLMPGMFSRGNLLSAQEVTN